MDTASRVMDTSASRAITVSVRVLWRALAIGAIVVLAAALWWLFDRQQELDKVATTNQEQVAAATADLETELTQLREDIEQELEAVGAGGQEVVRPIRRRLALISDCLPEMQSQINSMEVSYGYAFPNDTISTRCSGLFYGDISGGGE